MRDIVARLTVGLTTVGLIIASMPTSTLAADPIAAAGSPPPGQTTFRLTLPGSRPSRHTSSSAVHPTSFRFGHLEPFPLPLHHRGRSD